MKLGLTPLHQHDSALDGMLETWLEGLGAPHEWTEFLLHFASDALRIFLLLIVVMFAVSLLQTYIPFDKLKDRLARLSSLWGYLLALGLGVLSPFCSCTIIPVVMGFIQMGVPVQVALCYLTSAALLNGGAVAAVFSALGARFGAAYVLASALTALAVSLLIRPFCGQEAVIGYSVGHHHGNHCREEHCHDDACRRHEPASRLGYCLENVRHVLGQTWAYMLLSVALSSAVVAFVPMETLEGLLGGSSPLSPLLAALVGAPIHADAFALLPLLKLLLPINFSATLAFALGTMAVSVPEVLLLSRVFKPKTIAAYCGALVAFAAAAGYCAMLVGM